MSLYGTMQEIMPSASRRHLLGNSNSSRAPLMSFSSKQQRSQPAVLKTIISKRRSMTATNNNNIGVQSKSFVFSMLVSICIHQFINGIDLLTNSASHLVSFVLPKIFFLES